MNKVTVTAILLSAFVYFWSTSCLICIHSLFINQTTGRYICPNRIHYSAYPNRSGLNPYHSIKLIQFSTLFSRVIVLLLVVVTLSKLLFPSNELEVSLSTVADATKGTIEAENGADLECDSTLMNNAQNWRYRKSQKPSGPARGDRWKFSSAFFHYHYDPLLGFSSVLVRSDHSLTNGAALEFSSMVAAVHSCLVLVI